MTKLTFKLNLIDNAKVISDGYLSKYQSSDEKICNYLTLYGFDLIPGSQVLAAHNPLNISLVSTTTRYSVIV